MRYVLVSHESRTNDIQKLRDRIAQKGHYVRYIFAESRGFDEMVDETAKLLSYDDDICVIIPKWGEIRRWPTLYSSLGTVQIYSGVYGF